MRKIIDAYRTRRDDVESAIELFRTLFSIEGSPTREQEEALEEICTQKERQQEGRGDLLQSIGIKAYDMLHKDKFQELREMQVCFEVGGKYGVDVHPDNSHYDSNGILILR